MKSETMSEIGPFPTIKITLVTPKHTLDKAFFRSHQLIKCTVDYTCNMKMHNVLYSIRYLVSEDRTQSNK